MSPSRADAIKGFVMIERGRARLPPSRADGVPVAKAASRTTGTRSFGMTARPWLRAQ